MADPKSPQDILGLEYDWLASDSEGYVAFFSTAGGGYAPGEFLHDTDAHDRAIEAIEALDERTFVAFLGASADGNLTTWTRMAERGLFAFDADVFGGPYKLIAAPAVPAQLHELPTSAVQVVRSLRFLHLSFNSAQELAMEDFTTTKR